MKIDIPISSLQVNIMKSILHPKAQGLTGKHKPGVILIHSPYEAEDSALNYKAKVSHLQSEGFCVLNKRRINFDFTLPEIQKSLKPYQQVKGQIIPFLMTHGYPGHLFGEHFTPQSEIKGLFDFLQFYSQLEKILQANKQKVEYLILGGCYTACELLTPQNSYVCPARLLSQILPHQKILGFLGAYADAKITGLLGKEDQEFQFRVIPPEKGSIVFQNGNRIMGRINTYYIDTSIIPLFIQKELEIDAEIIKIHDSVAGEKSKYSDWQRKKIQDYGASSVKDCK